MATRNCQLIPRVAFKWQSVNFYSIAANAVALTLYSLSELDDSGWPLAVLVSCLILLTAAAFMAAGRLSK